MKKLILGITIFLILLNSMLNKIVVFGITLGVYATGLYVFVGLLVITLFYVDWFSGSDL